MSGGRKRGRTGKEAANWVEEREEEAYSTSQEALPSQVKREK
jgi:hypothetical protein